MNDLPPAIVNDLIALGSLEDSPSAERDRLLARLKPFERVNCLAWDQWNELADRLPEVELRNLVHGLTAAELELHWSGGSVAAVIWVYRRYESLFPDRADELADWVLARTENPYVPFGGMRAGARSVAEYRSHLAAKARRHDESEQEQEDARQHKRIRAIVRRRLAQERRLLQAAHNRARAEITAQLQELPTKQRLEHMAWDDFHSLAFYPASFTKIDRQTFEHLDAGTRKRLMDKIAARRKGAWKKLFIYLSTMNTDRHPKEISRKLLDSLRECKLICIHGATHSGKSSLAREIIQQIGRGKHVEIDNFLSEDRSKSYLERVKTDELDRLLLESTPPILFDCFIALDVLRKMNKKADLMLYCERDHPDSMSIGKPEHNRLFASYRECHRPEDSAKQVFTLKISY